jgi:hypothetical protein
MRTPACPKVTKKKQKNYHPNKNRNVITSPKKRKVGKKLNHCHTHLMWLLGQTELGENKKPVFRVAKNLRQLL